MSKNISFVQGNEAIALGAMYAGLDFYAGYPITPSTEVAESLAMMLPAAGKKFIQMEDEIASMCAIIGASLTGKKVMTATSGPGFSLMQENLGYACITETPCVIVNVMRGGPSTGLPTSPAQADVMQGGPLFGFRPEDDMAFFQQRIDETVLERLRGRHGERFAPPEQAAVGLERPGVWGQPADVFEQPGERDRPLCRGHGSTVFLAPQ